MQHVSQPRSVDPKRVVAALNALVEACKDGEKGYKNAAADARDPTCRALFTHFSQQRAQFAGALQSIVERHGAFAENNGSVVGALRRGWADLKSALEGGNDRAVLASCERAEDLAKREYERALEKALPYDVELLVKAQYAAIVQAHDEIKNLRDLHR